jgi:hypothetical protein
MNNTMNINKVETINQAEKIYNGTVNETKIDKVNTMNIAENNNGPMIDNEPVMSFAERVAKLNKKQEEVSGNIYAIAFKEKKASIFTNVKDIKELKIEGQNKYDGSLNLIYAILETIKENSSYKKQMNTIIVSYSYENLVDNKNIYNNPDLKALVNAIIQMKQELKDCVTFKKASSYLSKKEQDIKDKAWKLVKEN